MAGAPEAPTLDTTAPPVLRLPDRRALLPETDARVPGVPATALLLAMAADLCAPPPARPGAAAGPWAFLAEIPGGVWLALADLVPAGAAGEERLAISPRPGPEQIFDSPDAALAALTAHLETTDLAGLAVTSVPTGTPVRARTACGDTARGPLLSGLLSALAHSAPGLPVVEVSPSEDPRLPVFRAPRRVPLRLIGGAGAGLGLLLAGVFVIAPVIEEMLTPPPPPPPEMVAVSLPPEAFAAACTQALEAWWPRVVGWRVGTTGCALPGHLPGKPALTLPAPDPGAAPHVPLVVWRHLIPERARNRVLAGAAATRVMATWPHAAHLEAEGLTFWHTIPLPLERTGATSVAGPDTAARLAALWADTPGAVAVEGAQVRIATGRTPLATLFTRTVPGLAPVQMVQAPEGGTLRLAPPRPRSLAVDLLAKDTSS